jgi:hypothetical protein
MSSLSNLYNNEIDFESYNNQSNDSNDSNEQLTRLSNPESVSEKIKLHKFNQSIENFLQDLELNEAKQTVKQVSKETDLSFIDNNSEQLLNLDSFEKKFKKLLSKNK